jgi:hypothetical protein
VPVALMFVKLPVPELSVPIFPVVPVRVPIIAVAALKIFVARLPVTVTLLAVVEASVDEPDTVRLVNRPVVKARIFPRMFETVVEASVDEPVV